MTGAHPSDPADPGTSGTCEAVYERYAGRMLSYARVVCGVQAAGPTVETALAAAVVELPRDINGEGAAIVDEAVLRDAIRAAALDAARASPSSPACHETVEELKRRAPSARPSQVGAGLPPGTPGEHRVDCARCRELVERVHAAEAGFAFSEPAPRDAARERALARMRGALGGRDLARPRALTAWRRREGDTRRATPALERSPKPPGADVRHPAVAKPAAEPAPGAQAPPGRILAELRCERGLADAPPPAATSTLERNDALEPVVEVRSGPLEIQARERVRRRRPWWVAACLLALLGGGAALAVARLGPASSKPSGPHMKRPAQVASPPAGRVRAVRSSARRGAHRRPVHRLHRTVLHPTSVRPPRATAVVPGPGAPQASSPAAPRRPTLARTRPVKQPAPATQLTSAPKAGPVSKRPGRQAPGSFRPTSSPAS